MTQVPGFCYQTHKAVAMSPKDWRTRYPASAYRRRVENGETFYTPAAGDRPRLAAEAYAIIPK